MAERDWLSEAQSAREEARQAEAEAASLRLRLNQLTSQWLESRTRLKRLIRDVADLAESARAMGVQIELEEREHAKRERSMHV